MGITVMLEPLDSRGYRATGLVPTPLVAEGATREEALDQMRSLVLERLTNVEFVHMDVPPPPKPHAWDAIFGRLKGHPDAAEVEENIREYRRQVDQDMDWV